MRAMKTVTRPVQALIVAALVGACFTPHVSFAADSGTIEGPDFKAWDLKFGLIGHESGAWISNAIQNGTLDNRAVSCKVYKETTNLVYPLPPEPAPPGVRPDDWMAYHVPPRYGLTFEYATTKPNLPVSVVINYPPDSAGQPRTGGGIGFRLPGETTGKTGRFCFYQWSDDLEAQIPGTRCYHVTVEGVPLPVICVYVVNPNAP